MFEFFFKYPPTVFAKGDFALLARWPVWVLIVAVLGAAGGLGWAIWRSRKQWSPGLEQLRRPAAIWLLQSTLAGLVLLLLWRPAISVATLKPQQNIVAVVVDDSRSMSIREGIKTRIDQAVEALNGVGS